MSSASLQRISKIQSRHFRSAYFGWRENQRHDKELLIAAAVAFYTGFLLFFIQGHHTGFGAFNALGASLLHEDIWAHITFTGDTLVALTICLIFLVRYPQLALALLAAVIIGTLFTHTLKPLFDAARPALVVDLDVYSVIGPVYKRHSFPSGHTVTAFVLCGVLTRCFDNSWWRRGLLVIAIFIGWSRVVAVVHWPIDVAFGAGLGLLAAWLSLKISDRWKVSKYVYLPMASLLLLAAVLLFDFDGGFDCTVWYARLLSVFALLAFVSAWLYLIKSALHSKKVKLTTFSDELYELCLRRFGGLSLR